MTPMSKPAMARYANTGHLLRLAIILPMLAWGVNLHADNASQGREMEHSQMDHSQHGDGDDAHAEHRQMTQSDANEAATAEIEIAEGFTLLNQHGESVDLRRDIIGDRIAVVDFVYTSCTTVCPVVSTIFSQVQERLGDLLEKDVALVTLTVDPARDTPHRLMSYSKNFQPGPNWSWLTGEKRIMDKVLTDLGAYTPLYEDHPAMVLIGDENNSEWYRLYGFPAPDKIESRVREMLAHRQH